MIWKYAEIFCWKNVSSFCSAKATHIFSANNIRILYTESAKTVNEMTLIELVKLTMLWITGPWFLQVDSKDWSHCMDTRQIRVYIESTCQKVQILILQLKSIRHLLSINCLKQANECRASKSAITYLLLNNKRLLLHQLWKRPLVVLKELLHLLWWETMLSSQHQYRLNSTGHGATGLTGT